MKKFLPLILAFALIFFGIIWGVYHEIRRERLLGGETRLTKSILKHSYVSFRDGETSILNVLYDNQSIELMYYRKFDFLDKGDTILIKYSVEDPTVIEVVDPCYMQKHKGKPYCK